MTDPTEPIDAPAPAADVPSRLVIAAGEELRVARTDEIDHDELHAAFTAAVVAGEGYPQAPDQPVTWDAFRAYWLEPARASVVARSLDTAELVGAYTMKPNGVGRAAHVANVGYLVVPGWRGRGAGTALVEHSLDVARALGFDAMQFNFVFESNPARRLYERLGFELVGRVPEVIDGEAVCIYWRRL
jgi:GNAT superfamily N-acetyltransferase